VKEGIVLAAGNGDRLRPLTKVVPKFAVPVGDRPLIMYPIQFLLDHGCSKVVVVVREQDLPTAKNVFKGRGKQIQCLTCAEDGEMAALRSGMEGIKGDSFWVAFCDNVTPPGQKIDLCGMEPPFVLLYRNEDLARTGKFGAVTSLFDDGDRFPILKVGGVRRQSVGGVVQTGLMALRFSDVSTEETTTTEISDLLDGLGQSGVLRGMELPVWRDVGDLASLAECEKLLGLPR
jgi:dTDP-glucose pyrophosphorylase